MGFTRLWFWASVAAGLGFAFAAALRCAFLKLFLVTATFMGGFDDGIPAAADFGAVTWCVISTAGFIPAAMAALADTIESGACFTVPCKSGFTMICRS